MSERMRLAIQPPPSNLRNRMALVPVALAQRRAIDRDVDIEHDRLAVAHGPKTSLQGTREVCGACDLLAFQPVRFRDLRVLDVRIAEVSVEVLPRLVERAAIEH